MDPKVNYTAIDKWMSTSKQHMVREYCFENDLPLCDVIKIWYEASQPQGLMMEGWYFEEYKLRMDVDGSMLNNNQYYVCGVKKNCKIQARSYIMQNGHQDRYFGNLTGHRFHIESSELEGVGYVTEIKQMRAPVPIDIKISLVETFQPTIEAITFTEIEMALERWTWRGSADNKSGTVY